MQAAMDELDTRGIGWEFDVRSAHRTPDAVAEYAKGAADRPAGSRMTMCCGTESTRSRSSRSSCRTLSSAFFRSSMSVLDGMDALLSIVQMPPGVPVAAVGVDNAKNAAVLAARILALT